MRMAMGESAEAFVSTLTGAELRAALTAFKANERTARVALWPAALAERLDPAARYRVAFGGDIVWAWMQAVGRPMPNIELIHADLFVELERQAKRGPP